MGFKFKQFTINDDRCAMKVGTDSILLGAMAQVGLGQRVLDIGCGCGLLAIMLAQRTEGNATIVAVEIDAPGAAQARHNVAACPWPDTVTVVNEDIGQYQCQTGFDLIISNPPYFSDSLLGPDDRRNRARHNDGLSPLQLLQAVKRLLANNGWFWLILPVNEARPFIAVAEDLALALVYCVEVHSVVGKSAHRYVMAFKQQITANKAAGGPLRTEYLHIYDQNHQYSKQFIALTQKFYLNR